MMASAATWLPSPLILATATYGMATGISKPRLHSSPKSPQNAKRLRTEKIYDAAGAPNHRLFPSASGCRERRQQEHHCQLQLYIQVSVSLCERSTRKGSFGALPGRSRRAHHPRLSGTSGTRVPEYATHQKPATHRYPLVL